MIIFIEVLRLDLQDQDKPRINLKNIIKNISKGEIGSENLKYVFILLFDMISNFSIKKETTIKILKIINDNNKRYWKVIHQEVTMIYLIEIITHYDLMILLQ